MIPYEFDAERFSRWIAYVLRHNPARYGLSPDRHGYVDLETFLQIAKRRYPALTEEWLRGFLTSAGAARFELTPTQLRARYGHSIPVEPPGPPVEPPAQLYHGMEASRIERVLAEGLQPVDRRMLHLSETAAEALAVAQRKSTAPAIVTVRAQEAFRAGVAFFREGRVYLAAAIPPGFLKAEATPAANP